MHLLLKLYQSCTTKHQDLARTMMRYLLLVIPVSLCWEKYCARILRISTSSDTVKNRFQQDGVTRWHAMNAQPTRGAHSVELAQQISLTVAVCYDVHCSVTRWLQNSSESESASASECVFPAADRNPRCPCSPQFLENLNRNSILP